MAQKPLDEAVLRAALDAVKAANGNITEAARSLGIPRPTFQHQYYTAIRRGLGDGLVAPAPTGHTVKGISTLYDEEGQIVQQWVKTRADEYDIEQIIETIKAAFDDLEAAPPVPPPPDHDASLATLYPLPDLHMGLYAWGKEAGEDYDLSIADRVNREAFGRLVASTPASRTAVVLGLGDLIHADNTENRTARSGNSLDVDTRYSRVLHVATQFMVYAVDQALRHHERVIVRNLPGNHDTHSALAVGMALWAWYRNEPRVTVDTDPSYFWWWQFGANFLGATHGDMTKMNDLPLVMAASKPEAWGSAKHRLILTGHIHHKSALERGGVIVESFQSTAARDAWHQASGFRSGRSLTAITLHQERGEIARAKVTI